MVCNAGKREPLNATHRRCTKTILPIVRGAPIEFYACRRKWQSEWNAYEERGEIVAPTPLLEHLSSFFAAAVLPPKLQ
jgi:ribosomal protein L14E/L6E/L27E